ncbi:MAG: hypothetical protein WCI55_04670 [Armatimonadota bacterium]
MIKLIAVALALSFAFGAKAQQLDKLRAEDIYLVRGIGFTSKPCGATSATPEEQLEKNENHRTQIDVSKWLGYIQRAKSVRTGYDKWWATITVSLSGERQIIFDGQGYFCLRTKDPKVFYYYQVAKRDYEELYKSWNAIKAAEK